MFRRELLRLVRPHPSDTEGLIYTEGTEEDGLITSGATRSPTGETYEIRSGYLDLLRRSTGAHSPANLANLLPGAGPGYEPLWRVRSLNLLTGEHFPNDRELRVISETARPDHSGLFLDLGCSAGLYTRHLSRELGASGDVIGIDISPSMLKEAARRSRNSGASPSFARADAHRLPFADATFSGAVCGGTLNELADPARALRETARILRPGGRLAVMGILHARTRRGRRLQRLLSTGGLRFFRVEEITSLLDHSGFATDPLRTHGSIFFASAELR